MKKILLVLLLCYFIGFTVGMTLEFPKLAHRVTEIEEQTYYTQEEVDALLKEIIDEHNGAMVDIANDIAELEFEIEQLKGEIE